MRNDLGKNMNITEVISHKYSKNHEKMKLLKEQFSAKGYVKLPGFLSNDVFEAISSDVWKLHRHRTRKDFVMPELNTDRKMSVISGKDVINQSDIIPSLYANHELRSWISYLVGTDVHTVMHNDEFLVLNFLDGKRDTHGWHLDDPRYALIIIIESPEKNAGGQIEFICDWKRLAKEESFSPDRNIEYGIEICERKGQLNSDTLRTGDCYLLEAGEVMHRVSPMSADGSRKALNFGFDDRRFRVYGQTATKLYA